MLVIVKASESASAHANSEASQHSGICSSHHRDPSGDLPTSQRSEYQADGPATGHSDQGWIQSSSHRASHSGDREADHQLGVRVKRTTSAQLAQLTEARAHVEEA